MVSEQFNPAIFDLGSSTVRVGWAGHDQPKFVESCYLGRKADGGLEPVPLRFLKRTNSDVSVVERAQEFKHASTQWELQSETMRALCDTLLYSNRGLNCAPLERPVFVTCPTGAPFRKEYYEHFLETVQAPAFFIGDSSVLAMYAVGRTSGLCVDVGASALTVAYVDKGTTTHFKTHPFGGDSIDSYILSRVEGIEGNSLEARLALAREIKHNACRCSHHTLPPAPPVPTTPARSTRGRKAAPTPSPTSKQTQHGDQSAYLLPDGTEVDVSGVQEYAAECLFTEQGEFGGLTNAVTAGPADSGGDGFVLLTGGSAHFPGLHTRLVHELDSAIGQGASTVFPFAQWTHRVHSTFVGASILASLSSFASLWVTPQTLAEVGIDKLETSI